MWNYPVTLISDTNGTILLTVDGVDGAHTFGDTKADALAHGEDALLTAFIGYMRLRRAIPTPRRPKRGQATIHVSTLAALKLLLYEVMRQRGTRKSDLARQLDVSPTIVDRLLDLRHPSRLAELERALGALGRHYEVSLAVAS